MAKLFYFEFIEGRGGASETRSTQREVKYYLDADLETVFQIPMFQITIPWIESVPVFLLSDIDSLHPPNRRDIGGTEIEGHAARTHACTEYINVRTLRLA